MAPNRRMTTDEIEAAFASLMVRDGALRDVRLVGGDWGDWAMFLTWAEASGDSVHVKLEAGWQAASGMEWLLECPPDGRCLGVRRAGVQLNVWQFSPTDSEGDADLSPKEVRGGPDLAAAFGMLGDLAAVTKRQVDVLMEGSVTEVLMTVSPGREFMFDLESIDEWAREFSVDFDEQLQGTRGWLVEAGLAPVTAVARRTEQGGARNRDEGA